MFLPDGSACRFAEGGAPSRVEEQLVMLAAHDISEEP